MEHKEPLVLDIGDGETRIGGAGLRNRPYQDFPTYVVRPKGSHTLVVGAEVSSRWGPNDRPPVQHQRVITDFDQYELLLKKVYSAIPTAEHPVLFTRGSFVPAEQLPKVAELFFEKFDVPAFSSITKEAAALEAWELGFTGVVVDMGFSTITIVPFLDGRRLSHASIQVPFGGDQLTLYLHRAITERDMVYQWTQRTHLYEVNNMKHTMCRASLDPERELHPEIYPPPPYVPCYDAYILQDCGCVCIQHERLFPVEALFNPKAYLQLECAGVHDEIVRAVELAVPPDTPDIESVKQRMADNILLGGGSSAFKDLSKRLQMELDTLKKERDLGFRPVVREWSKMHDSYPVSPTLITYFGAHDIADNSKIQRIGGLLTRAEYEEHGSAVVNSRFLV